MAKRARGAIEFLRETACSTSIFFKNARGRYAAYVLQNPETITQVEKTVKALSYALEFIPRDYENSIFLTEILNSANSLFTFINDTILTKSTKFFLGSPGSANLANLLERWLTVMEYTQALIEMSVNRLCGRRARWAVIVLVSLLKVTLRLVLLHWFKSGIHMHPPTKPLMREALIDDQRLRGEAQEARPVFSTGKRTGTVMRKLDHSIPVHSRTWKLPDSTELHISRGATDPLCASEIPSDLTQMERVGETLHCIRPLMHLIGVGIFGTQSIVPWLASLITDVSSQAMISGRVDQSMKHSMLNKSERGELQRRVIVLLFYLLRSPIYDRFTKKRVLRLIQVLSDYVPLVHFILQPLARYLPAWQQVYFYVWKE